MRHRTGSFGLAAAALLTFAATVGIASDKRSTCGIAAHPKRHLGETIHFRGVYSSDGLERAIVKPVGCRGAFAVGAVPDDVTTTLDQDTLPGMYPPDVEAVFIGIIVRVPPNGAQFFKDSGMRLDIIRVQDVKVRAGS
jgi:hypothetical protein